MNRIRIKLGRTVYFVATDSIKWIESDRNYIRIHLGDRSFLLRDTLGNFEKKLDDRQFVRVNRSIIVNIDRIKELRFHSKTDYRVVLDDDRSWIWGRRYRHNLNQILN